MDLIFFLTFRNMEVNIERVKSKLKEALKALFQDDFSFASEVISRFLVILSEIRTN